MCTVRPNSQPPLCALVHGMIMVQSSLSLLYCMHVHYVHPLRKAFDFSLKLLRAAAACERALDEARQRLGRAAGDAHVDDV